MLACGNIRGTRIIFLKAVFGLVSLFFGPVLPAFGGQSTPL